jgi:elongation factor G
VLARARGRVRRCNGSPRLEESMARYAPQDVRNFAFVGSSGAGKTTLIESLLHKAGAIQRRGNVADGSSQVDFDAEEKEKKHSLFMKAFHAVDHKREMNLLDTPGYPDYIGEALAAVSAVETAVFCINAVTGITFHARRLWQAVVESGRGRMIVVTHIDQDGVDVDAIVDRIHEAFGDSCVPANLPAGAGSKLSAVVDVFGEHASVPAGLEDLVHRSHQLLVEALVTLDEKAMEKYLETGEAKVDELVPLMKEGIARGSLTPILFVASTKDIGVEDLLHFFADDCPSPVRGPHFTAAVGTDASGAKQQIEPSKRNAFAGRVFKTVIDPFVGRLSYVRVVSGQVKIDDHYLNVRTGKLEKMGHILRPKGKETETLDFAQAGDIVLLPKNEHLETDDTLCAESDPIVFTRMPLPRPMVALAVHAKNRADEQKMVTTLRKHVAEDPTLSLERDSQTAELILRGISGLHLQTVLHRIHVRYKIEIETKIPRVPLRETVLGHKVEGHHRHKKQTGGRGQFAEVYLRLSANERGKGFEFEDDTHGGSIPKNFLPAIERGIQEQMTKGVIAGYPVVDVKVSVYDGKYHDVDSDEMSFKVAGARAFRDAFEKAKPVMLEPIVSLQAAVPNKYMGDATSDLNSRRGRITGMDTVGDTQVITAEVPQKEIQTYAQDLRSITHGEGSFTYEFSRYDVAPHHVAVELTEIYKAERAKELEE